MQTIFTLLFIALSLRYIYDSTVRPISTSIVHKPKQLATESQITLSCEVEGSVPDTDIKWTQNNRVFERGSVSLSAFAFKATFFAFWCTVERKANCYQPSLHSIAKPKSNYNFFNLKTFFLIIQPERVFSTLVFLAIAGWPDDDGCETFCKKCQRGCQNYKADNRFLHYN